MPTGWRAEPAEEALDFHRRGEKQEVEFKIFPAVEGRSSEYLARVLSQAESITAKVTAWSTREDLTLFIIISRLLQTHQGSSM